jgi:hypothetical protein
MAFLCKKLKSITNQKIWLAVEAQSGQSPHRTKVKGLTPAADSANGENDDKRYKKMVSHNL